MSVKAEKTLLQHLKIVESLKVLAREDLPDEVLPTPELRPVVHFALRYFFQSDGEYAPTVDVLQKDYGHLLADFEVEIEYEPEETIEWAIEDLKGTYASLQGQKFANVLQTKLLEAEVHEQVDVLDAAADTLFSQIVELQSSTEAPTAPSAIRQTRMRFEERRAAAGRNIGMHLGLAEVDAHTLGVHPGELAILAAGPKQRKSMFLAYAVLSEWRAGRASCLFTLENSVEMTWDRLVCLAGGFDPRGFQRGELTDEEMRRFAEHEQGFVESSTPLWVIRPDIGKRSAERLVREALLREVDSLFIDQLSFMDGPDLRRPRHEQVREIMHRLKEAISTGRRPMPCLLAHQINREGLKEAAKVQGGRLQMHHLAESSEVERTSDFVFALYNRPEQDASQILFQMLAARRTDLQDWELIWDLANGVISVEGRRDWVPEPNRAI